MLGILKWCVCLLVLMDEVLHISESGDVGGMDRNCCSKAKRKKRLTFPKEIGQSCFLLYRRLLFIFFFVRNLLCLLVSNGGSEC